LAAQKITPPIQAGFFESIFNRALVNQRQHEYEEKIATQSNQLRNAEIAETKRQLPKLKADLIERALSRNNPPQFAVYGFQNRRSMKDVIEPTLVKYFNAVRFSILSGVNKSPRLEPEEWEWLRKKILHDDDYLCRICKEESQERHVHHIIPLSKFGSNHPHNLITLCYSCHNSVHPDINVTQHIR